MKYMTRWNAFWLVLLAALPLCGDGVPAELPDPDGKEADMSKPVQVFILMGQSNMVGIGKTAGLKWTEAATNELMISRSRISAETVSTSHSPD